MEDEDLFYTIAANAGLPYFVISTLRETYQVPENLYKDIDQGGPEYSKLPLLTSEQVLRVRLSAIRIREKAINSREMRSLSKRRCALI